MTIAKLQNNKGFCIDSIFKTIVKVFELFAVILYVIGAECSLKMLIFKKKSTFWTWINWDLKKLFLDQFRHVCPKIYSDFLSRVKFLVYESKSEHVQHKCEPVFLQIKRDTTKHLRPFKARKHCCDVI